MSSVNQCKRQIKSASCGFSCTFPPQKTELLSTPPPKMLPSPCFQQSVLSLQRLPVFWPNLASAALILHTVTALCEWQQQIICPSHSGGKWHRQQGVVWGFFSAWIGRKCSIGYWRFTLTSQLTGLAINSESSQYKPVTNEHWVTLVKY